MKCQECDAPATHHVTELVRGEPTEYHVCDTHLKALETLQPARPHAPDTGFAAFTGDPTLAEALQNAVAWEKAAAYQLPALCLALHDENPEVRVLAAFRLMAFGADAESTLGALQEATRDPDERVRKAAKLAHDFIKAKEKPWFLWMGFPPRQER